MVDPPRSRPSCRTLARQTGPPPAPESRWPPRRDSTMRYQSALFLVIIWGTLTATAGASGLPKSLEVLPARARLLGPEATQRLVVLGVFEDGSRVDMTPQAQFESTQCGIVT